MKENIPAESASRTLNFQRLFESIPGLYMVLAPDEKYTIVAASDSFLRSTMTKREEIIGEAFFEVFPSNPTNTLSSSESNLKASLASVIRDRKPDTMAIQQYDIRQPAAAGGEFEERYWSPTSTPILGEDGAVEYIIHQVEDVTEFVRLKKKRSEEGRLTQELQDQSEEMEVEIYNRMIEIKRAKEALEVSNARYAALNSMLPVGIFHADSEGKYVFITPRLYDITGNSLAEVTDKLWYEQVYPEDKARIIDEWNSCKLDSRIFDAEFRILLPGGQVKWVLVQITPEFSRANKLIGYIGSVMDIDRRLQEEVRAKLLIDMDAAKTVFFGSMSHEYKTPLTLVLGPVMGPLKDDSADSDTSLHEKTKLIHQNSFYLLKLVNSLLDFSRLEVDQTHAAFQPVDFSDLTLVYANVFRSLFEKSGIDFMVDAPPLNEPVYLDKEMYRKVIINLLSNAFKYTFQGAVKLSVKKKESTIELRVQDCGIGIPPEDLPHLFDKFHGVGSQAPNYAGSGLSLALVKEIVRMHGGKIEVESTVGVGTAFIVNFSRWKEHLLANKLGVSQSIGQIGSLFVEEVLEELPCEAAIEGGHKDQARETILVVSDNAGLREYLRNSLGSLWQVEVAGSCEEALVLAKTNAPDLVLSDMMMPRIDGYQLIQQLRNNEATRFVPVILLACRAGEDACREGLHAGAFDCLTKPFSAIKLLARVKAHLELISLRYQLEEQVQQLRQANTRSKAEALERNRLEGRVEEEHLRADVAEEYKKKLTDFIDTVCHEVRNPLTTIYGGIPILLDILESLKKIVQSISDKFDVELTDKFHQKLFEATELVRIMGCSAQHQKTLVDDILNLSKFESGRFDLNPEAFELRRFIDSIYLMFKEQLRQKNLSFTLNLSEEKLWLMADRSCLSQALINLISNAIKFTNMGGVTVNITPEALSASEIRLHFNIKDTGNGMSPEEMSRLFNRFSQANRRIASEYGGSGLGLVISKKIIEKMGGYIEVDSKKDVGTSINFSVMCGSLSAENKSLAEIGRYDVPRAEKYTAMDSIKGKRILVVEDEKVNQKILVNLLKKMGCISTATDNGKEALAAYRESKFDLIITDLEMPVMGGLELAKSIRALEHSLGSRTPIVACTGYSREEIKVKSLSFGMDAYITKPYSSDDLYQVIKKLTAENERPSLKAVPNGDMKPRLETSAKISSFLSSSSSLFSAISRKREGLFFHEHPNNAQAEALLKGFTTKHNLVEAEALGSGDCFFDAVAESLNRLFGPHCYTVKSLRLMCDSYARESGHEWLKPALLADRDDYDSYISRISFTADEMDEANKYTATEKIAVWGRPAIEGRIFCEKLGIKLHVVEIQHFDEGGARTILAHQLVDAGIARSVDEASIDYSDDKLIHLAVYNNHFVSLRPLVLASTVVDRDLPAMKAV